MMYGGDEFILSRYAALLEEVVVAKPSVFAVPLPGGGPAFMSLPAENSNSISNGKVSVAQLRQQLEELFPGKWLTGQDPHKLLRCGVSDIDNGIMRGFPRRSLTEWTGPLSSGKTTLLRSAVAYWCQSGFNVAYIDTFSRLMASDWTFVEKGICGATPTNLVAGSKKTSGQFIVVRVSESLGAEDREDRNSSNSGKRPFALQVLKDAYWVSEQFIQSNLFDAVLFDLGESYSVNSRVYARLHRALDKSKSALILLRDSQDRKLSSNWGASGRAEFGWSHVFSCESGVKSNAVIVPGIKGSIFRDGLTQNMEIKLNSNVTNCLFTHSQIPDRRTSKTRPRTKG